MTTSDLAGDSMLEELRGARLFRDFSDDQLRWLAERSEIVTAAAGAQVVSEDGWPDHLWVLLSGEVQLTCIVAGREIVLQTTDQPGASTGWLPMVEGPPVTFGVRLLRDSRLLRIERAVMSQMLALGYPLAASLIADITAGIHNFEALVRQQEKLAALGKLAAGLAHELNNPAAAAHRGASRLRADIAAHETRALALGQHLDAAGLAFLNGFLRRTLERAGTTLDLDPLARGEREDALADWLEAHDVEDAWAIAPVLAGVDIGPTDLDEIAAHLPAETLPDALGWLGATLDLTSLAREIELSTARISELVRTVKAYSYMDQAGLKEIDIHTGLDDTLTILGHRLREQSVRVVRRYDRSLPRILAWGSDLNQVWTNLLDNAIDALSEVPADARLITLRTAREGDHLLVEIADSGPGIPPAIQDRIFEPFFTTKEVGIGNGIGLDISYRIVAGRHGGDIRVFSQPGDTRFQVRLPLRLPVVE